MGNKLRPATMSLTQKVMPIATVVPSFPVLEKLPDKQVFHTLEPPALGPSTVQAAPKAAEVYKF